MSLLRRSLTGGAILLAFVGASAAGPRQSSIGPAAGSGRLVVYGLRPSPGAHPAHWAKLDGALAEVAEHRALVHPARAVRDLHALAPAARFRQTDAAAPAEVAIDAVTRGDPRRLEQQLTALGLRASAVFLNDVGGWLPVDKIEAAAALAELHSLRAAMPRTRAAGPVANQGDYVQYSHDLRALYPALTGAGVKVGVLSDSFDCYSIYAANPSAVPKTGAAGWASNGFTADYASDVQTGALPAGVSVLSPTAADISAFCLNYGAPQETPFGDEGRAMMQIVHVVAPGAGLAFYTAFPTEADFANGMDALASAGAKVVMDDVGYFDEPFFQDGLLAQAINAVEAKGVAYFSAAGNNGRLAYDNDTPSFAPAPTIQPDGLSERLLNFDTSGATTNTSLPITIASLFPGEYVALVLEWDQPYVTGAPGSPGASSQLDICITGANGTDTITDVKGNNLATACIGANKLGQDPIQYIFIGNPAETGNPPTVTQPTAAENMTIQIGLVSGTAPGRIKFVVEDDGAGSTINKFANNGSTLQGHPSAAGAAAVGAAWYFLTPRCGTSPATIETFSAAGGDPILFDTSGNRLAIPIVRQKPDFVAPEGTNDTFLGFTLANSGIPGGTLNTQIPQCQNNTSYPNFFGTSAATPHAGAIAALMLQANPGLTPKQIYDALRSTASAMGKVPNFDAGYGFIDALSAMAALPPGPPTLTMIPTTIVAGTTATLTWSSINANACQESGSWSEKAAASGSFIAGPGTPGSYTYSMACSNALGTSTVASVKLTVTAPMVSSGGGGGGGGGALDAIALVLLAARALVRGPRRA